ncbi:MAG: Radical domain protein [Firmicutes bacterium]|nr:Radical domain protein [Bacillota bacterium]
MDKSNQMEIQQLIVEAAKEGNILPITSGCDSQCIFCSHKNNPPGIDVISIGVRSIEEIIQTMNYLDSRKVITIGESASNIIEGEPFCHPDIRKIIQVLRERFLATPIEITTNGHCLTSDLIDFIDRLGNISLNISLNSASVEGRKMLMGDTKEQAEMTIAGVKLLAEKDVAFNSSIVAMPNITGWEDLKRTIQFLSENKTRVIRIYFPAFSGKKEDIFPDSDEVYAQLREFISHLTVDCPVLLEPSCVTDLTPAVSGILKNSSAWKAGIRQGDVIRLINGEIPRCRVEAWNMLECDGLLWIVAERNGQKKEYIWENGDGCGSGITMEYDFDMRRAEYIRQLILHQTGKTLLLTSEFGHAVVQAVLELLHLPIERAEAVMVKNNTFGGTIKAAGLLTVDDYYATFEEWANRKQEKICQIFVPSESFNSLGFDLKHQHYTRLWELTKIPVWSV